MKRITFAIMLFALLFALSGCETTGSSRGASKNCQSSNTSGSCTITIQEIEGTVSQKVENSSFRTSHRETEVTVNVTVGSGNLEVYVDGPNEQHTAVQVAPGQTAEMTGNAAITGASDKGFNVYFKAVDGKAGDIKAEVTYSVK